MKDVLSINNLTVAFETEEGELTAVKGASLTLAEGEILALVGESGCGKTVLCKSMLHILCSQGRIRSGEILLKDPKAEKEIVDLAAVSEKEMRHYRGGDIGMVFQDPMTSLNPMMSIGKQIAEVLRIHGSISREAAKKRAIELMALVDIDHPEKRYAQMPHHFSGGMRQRVAIAIALAGNPKVLLADEPTTSLDLHTQRQILELLKEVQQKVGIATILITHDLSLVEDIADRVAVMKDGEIVEVGTVKKIFDSPQHAYTQRLLSYANYGKAKGHTHGAIHFHDGAVHAHKTNAIHEHTSLQKIPEGNLQEEEILIEIKEVKKHFKLDKRTVNQVLDGISFKIYKGEVLGMIGASGCGKSTLARCIMQIYKLDSGEIVYHDDGRRQMIFQDSSSAFNPRRTIGEIIGEPIRIQDGKMPPTKKIYTLMEQVELERNLINRHPYEVSGGQRQRAAIARAISTDPRFIIADEPISSLDVSIQAQIIHLFKTLQAERGLTLLLIAHDLPMVQHISDRIIQF